MKSLLPRWHHEIIDFWGFDTDPFSSTPLDQRAHAESLLAIIAVKDKRRSGENRSSRVAVNLTTDFLDPAVPIEWLADLLFTLYRYPIQTYLLVTKKPELWQQRLRAVSNLNHEAARLARDWLQGNYPMRIWIGTEIRNQEDTLLLNILAAIPCACHFAVFKPTSSINILTRVDSLGWIVVEGETGNDALPLHPDFPAMLCEQAKAADVPFWFDRWGEFSPLTGDSCSVCGCTEWDCSGCVARTGEPCHWVGIHLCSACEGAPRPTMGTRLVNFKRVGLRRAGRKLGGKEYLALPTLH